MEEKKVSKKKMSKGKRAVINLLAVALIIGATVAVTLALLSTTSEEVTNTFTASKDIKLELQEPNYNWVQVTDDPTTNNVDESTISPRYTDKPFPGDFQPGVTYEKNPTLYNTTGKNGDELAEEWVAMRVDYYIKDGGVPTQKSYTEMCADRTQGGTEKGIIDPIQFDADPSLNVTTGSWIKVDLNNFGVSNNPKYDIYVYKYRLQAKEGFTAAPTAAADNKENPSTAADVLGVQTKPLFESVKVKSQEQLVENGYIISSLPTFEIKIKGAAVKHSTEISSVTAISSDNLTSGKPEYTIVKELVDLLKDKNS